MAQDSPQVTAQDAAAPAYPALPARWKHLVDEAVAAGASKQGDLLLDVGKWSFGHYASPFDKLRLSEERERLAGAVRRVLSQAEWLEREVTRLVESDSRFDVPVKKRFIIVSGIVVALAAVSNVSLPGWIAIAVALLFAHHVVRLNKRERTQSATELARLSESRYRELQQQFARRPKNSNENAIPLVIELEAACELLHWFGHYETPARRAAAHAGRAHPATRTIRGTLADEIAQGTWKEGAVP
jgi:hypothetical protein